MPPTVRKIPEAPRDPELAYDAVPRVRHKPVEEIPWVTVSAKGKILPKPKTEPSVTLGIDQARASDELSPEELEEYLLRHSHD
jgi:hypothetical protein